MTRDDHPAVEAYVADDLRDPTRNAPISTGEVPLARLVETGRILLRGVTPTDRLLYDALGTETVPLAALWAEEPFRGVYVPATEKSRLPPGSTPFLARVPGVKPFHLDPESLRYVDLDGLTTANRTRAERTMRPRLLFKVLRGSRLRVALEPTGEVVSTEKLVNVPPAPRDDRPTPHTLESLYAVLNSAAASYYFHRLVFSHTTETSRVMDAAYVRDVPIPTVSTAQAASLGRLAELCTFAKQVGFDRQRTEAGDDPSAAFRRGRTVERWLDALAFDCYFGELHSVDTDPLWDGAALLARRVDVAFRPWYRARFVDRETVPEGTADAVRELTAAVRTVEAESDDVVEQLEATRPWKRVAAVLQ